VEKICNYVTLNSFFFSAGPTPHPKDKQISLKKLNLTAVTPHNLNFQIKIKIFVSSELKDIGPTSTVQYRYIKKYNIYKYTV
jgi:hypothetical protein